ncbi:chemotaxis protein CheA [Natrinema salifodinae]|uniref:Chemotaxis protein CheA n=1 Tax=Natrinema salifodinae TaxID=1202768 RepID=A0A1I0N8S6_9EURY|nr:chemotaxis protein CheA [Natrinema salifodinae]SEV97307.1 two-component system, chemotaxis family, sensor kinase CheA [Natrinema salifodinae]
MTDYLTDFVQESEERITELNNALLTLERDPDDEDAMENIFRIAHTLKGNCGAMGLDSASDLAHAIEGLLDAVRSGDIDVTPELMDIVFDAVDELETMVDEVAATGDIETDPSATIDALQNYLDRAETASAGIDAPTADEIDAICSQFDPPADEGHDAYLTRLAIADEAGVNNGTLVVDALIDAFDLIGTVPSQDRIDAADYDGQFDAVFATAVGEAAIASGLEPVEEVADFEIVNVSDRFETDETHAAPAAAAEPADDISSEEAQDLEVDELLDEFDEFDDLDEMVEDVEDDELGAFEDMGEAGSFDDLLDEDDVAELQDDPGEPPLDSDALDDDQAAASEPTDADTDGPQSSDEDEVDDASAVFNELKDEVEMVGFDELQDELAELEFDEFDDEEEVGMDELLGDDAEEFADESFLESEDPSDDEIDDMLVDADSDSESDTDADRAQEQDRDQATGDAAAADHSNGDDTASIDEDGDDTISTDEDGPEPDATPVDASSTAPNDDSVGTTPAGDEASTDGAVADAADADAIDDTSASAASDTASDDAETGIDTADDAETAREADQPGDADEPDESGEPDNRVEADEPVETDQLDESDESDGRVEADEPAEPDEPGDDVETDEPSESDEPDDRVEADEPDESDDPDNRDETDELTESESPDQADDVDDDSFGEDVAADFDSTASFDDDLGSADDEDPFDEQFDETSFDDVTTDLDADVTDEDEFNDSDYGLDDEAFADTAEFDTADAGFDTSAETDAVADATDPDSEMSSAASFDDESAGSASETDADVVRIVDEPDFEIPDATIPATPDQPDADAETDEIQSVRVDVEQIDSLLTLVEGLVTSRVRLRHAADDDGTGSALDEEIDALSDLTTDLQETVMDIRLVPLQTVTNRLPRVVRDIARDQDKEVAFEMTGEDVELDRSILDRIGDPLIHLVRNAVDHGIESPDAREAAGKPREGAVEVRADRSRDRVTITVEDDGNGLDADQLRSEAVAADVLDEDEAAALADEEAYELIFHPGFSTAEEVTDVSGRGVGMDVVKRTIEDLDGTVAIDSDPDEGTTVTMELPVTVAIDEILFVECGGEEFGLPTKAILDVESADAIETVDGESVLPSEDGDYPVISLADVLETPAPAADDNGMVVRIRDEVREVALRCDHVRGQQEVVVKPFEGFMSGIPGLSGATVRGRGEVVNILDVTTL